MKRVLCIGNASYDVTLCMDNYPIENKKYRVPERVEGGGGPAASAAYLLGKWGVETYFAGVVGDDNYGRKIESELKSANVNTSFLEFDKNNDTTLSFILVNNSTGSRTVFANRDSDIKYSLNIDIKPDYILVDGQEYETSIKIMEACPDAISIIDAGRNIPNVVELAKKVDYVVCSREFAESYTGINIDFSDVESIKNIYSKMSSDFKNVVITLEEKGSLYKNGNNIIVMPSIKVSVKDSTGAGDYFHGAFIYCLINGFDMDKTIKISNVTGALSTTKVGARNSVPSLEEVMKYV